MKRFRFPLARVERLRGHAEAAARRQLGHAIATLAELQARLATIDANLGVCTEGERTGGRSLANAMTEGLANARRRVEQQIAPAERQVDSARANHAGARRDLRAVAAIRERLHGEWRAGALRTEQLELEECARGLVRTGSVGEEP